MAVDKTLRRVEWRCVLLAESFYQLELMAERLLKFFDVVSFNFKSAALQRSVISKSCEDHISARFDGAFQIVQVKLSVVRICKEMEDGTVVPEVVFVFG